VLANVAQCHALEIDDSHYPAIVHPTAPTLWAGLAAAEVLGGGVDGRALLTAIVAGMETMVRIALAAPRTIDNGYHTALYSGFGAAVTYGRLLGLGAAALVDALDIAFAQATASVQAGADGALVKPLQPAFNAAAGIRAVELARAGVTGIRRVMEGRADVGVLFNHAPIDRAALLDGLDTRFHAAELTTKLYPTSRCGHGPIEATLALVREHGIRPEQVREIRVAVQPSCFAREGEPFEARPGTPQVKAQFGLDWCVAAAVLWREVFVAQMQDDAVTDPRVLDLARRVRVERFEERPGATPYLPVRVAIATTAGKVHTLVAERLRGGPDRPLSWEEVVEERLRRCLPYAAVPAPEGRAEALSQACAALEDMGDVRGLLRLAVFAEDR
jgi:2-methylcitrate dehydratase PrpD